MGVREPHAGYDGNIYQEGTGGDSPTSTSGSEFHYHLYNNELMAVSQRSMGHYHIKHRITVNTISYHFVELP